MFGRVTEQLAQSDQMVTIGAPLAILKSTKEIAPEIALTPASGEAPADAAARTSASVKQQVVVPSIGDSIAKKRSSNGWSRKARLSSGRCDCCVGNGSTFGRCPNARIRTLVKHLAAVDALVQNQYAFGGFATR